LEPLHFWELLLASRRSPWENGIDPPKFRFGPYLAMAAVIFLFWGDPLIAWYEESLLRL
jgi:prepilin signal peptidase PulO-like enzyme (type II secretory pathway)